MAQLPPKFLLSPEFRLSSASTARIDIVGPSVHLSKSGPSPRLHSSELSLCSEAGPCDPMGWLSVSSLMSRLCFLASSYHLP